MSVKPRRSTPKRMMYLVAHRCGEDSPEMVPDRVHTSLEAAVLGMSPDLTYNPSWDAWVDAENWYQYVIVELPLNA